MWGQKVMEERSKNEERLKSMQQRLDRKDAKLLEEKQRRWVNVACEAAKRKAAEKDVRDLYE